jgi:hypothetical protein
VLILVVILYTGYEGMICIYIDIALHRTFSQFSFLACIVHVFYVVRQVVTHGVEDPTTVGVLESERNIHRPVFMFCYFSNKSSSL